MTQLTCAKNFVKFGLVAFETCERTDGQTDRHAHRNTSQPYRRQSKKWSSMTTRRRRW